MPDETTGHLIRDARKRRGMTQRQLGAAIDCGQASIARFESGTRAVSLETLLAIAAALKVRPATLMPRVADKKNS